MNEEARILFSKLVDANWRIDHSSSTIEKVKAYFEYAELEKQIIDIMGRAEYNRYIQMGRQMFAPKSH